MPPPIRHVISRDNPLLVRARKLAADPAAYRKFDEILIEGEHLCSAYASHGLRALRAVVGETAWQQEPTRGLALHADDVVVVPDALILALGTLESPAQIMFIVAHGVATEMLLDAPSIVLDRLQDPGNIGNILRSASAFGIRQVIALKGTAALWAPKVLRAGMGAHFGLRLVEGVLDASLATLRVPLLGTSSHATQALHEVELPWPAAWVVGHEGQGVSTALRERCRFTLRIPQPGGEESLNVAAAAAVCFYEAARQRAA